MVHLTLNMFGFFYHKSSLVQQLAKPQASNLTLLSEFQSSENEDRAQLKVHRTDSIHEASLKGSQKQLVNVICGSGRTFHMPRTVLLLGYQLHFNLMAM